jgi:crotonobetainyl-CoA:carnitine CoA-transferase CaiB-like acyl-CoA transferase
MSDVLESAQLRVRSYFVPYESAATGAFVLPGAPYRLSATPVRDAGPAPSLPSGQSSAQAAWVTSAPPDGGRARLAPGVGPLAGVRVLDFSRVWGGPLCTQQLANLGAEVIKVESNRNPDVSRRTGPFFGDEPGLNRSGFFNCINQGKRSITLNLASAEGVDLARRLAALSDVVVDNFSPGTMAGMGLDYASLCRIRPDIVCFSLSGYGGDGPESGFISYGPSIEALSGLASLSGFTDGPPADTGLSFGDPNAGMHAAVAILAALWHRDRTGEGQWIDAALLEALVAVIPEGVISQSMNGVQPPRIGNRDPWMSPHGIFPCRGEDAWLGIAVRDDREFATLVDAMGQPTLATDPRFATLAARKEREDVLEAIVRDWTAAGDRFELAARLQEAGVPAYPCMTMGDLHGEPHLAARGFFSRLPHPEVGVLALAGVPWRTSSGTVTVRGPAPLLGADNDAVFRGLLGLDETEMQRLVAERVLY